MKEHEYEFIGDDVLHVIIPFRYPLSLKLMVLAALKTYRFGNRSIDYVLKKYRDIWTEQLDILCSQCEGRGSESQQSEFIFECDHCGQFYCQSCLGWGNKSSEPEEILCPNCSPGEGKKRNKHGGSAQIINLEERRKRGCF